MQATGNSLMIFNAGVLVMIFLMTIFPGEEDYGAHRGREENERSPGPRVFPIQINGSPE